MNWLLVLFALALAPGPAWAQALDETIVLVRHAEKPPSGLGQLDCQGLNRALALPAVILRDFDHLDAIFAPNPAIMKRDGGTAYFYIRPLATIEPTAIFLGKTINISYGEDEWQKLGQAINGSAYGRKIVLAAWEHHNIVNLARWLMRQHGGDPASVPEWEENDFDSIYVLQIVGGHITFLHRREGLDREPTECKDAREAVHASRLPPSIMGTSPKQ